MNIINAVTEAHQQTKKLACQWALEQSSNLKFKAGFDKIYFTVTVENAQVDVANLRKYVCIPFALKHGVSVHIEPLNWYGENKKRNITAFEVRVHKPTSMGQINSLIKAFRKYNHPKSACRFNAYSYVELYVDTYLKNFEDYSEADHHGILAHHLETHVQNMKTLHNPGNQWIFWENGKHQYKPGKTDLFLDFLEGKNYRMGDKNDGDKKNKVLDPENLYTHAYLKVRTNRSTQLLNRELVRARFEIGFRGEEIRSLLNHNGLTAEAQAELFYMKPNAIPGTNDRIRKALQNLSKRFNKE
jgi:hypothetical protein